MRNKYSVFPIFANKIAKEQLVRMEELYKEGLKSLTDLETRKLKLQENPKW